MSKSLYLIGEPGVGKSTVVNAFCDSYTIGAKQQLLGKLWADQLLAEDELVGYRLGRTRETFSGTDALAMSVNPDAVAWVESCQLPTILVGEGARLANKKFLTALNENTSLLLVLVLADNAAERRVSRGSNQNPSWVKGRATASLNLFKEALELGWTTMVVNNSEQTPEESAAVIRGALERL